MKSFNLFPRTEGAFRYIFCIVFALFGYIPQDVQSAGLTYFSTSLKLQGIPTDQDSLAWVLNPEDLTAVDLQDYEHFKIAIRPMLEEMGSKKIVALGEGTHGSSEFHTVRHWITRLLIEEYGFNKVAFESDYADAFQLNKALQEGNRNYTALMKENLLSIWQNKEVESLLKWIQSYNQAGLNKVDFHGIDYPFVSNNAKIILEVLGRKHHPEMLALANKLSEYANYQDVFWNGGNEEDFNPDMKEWYKNGLAAYGVIEQIEQGIPQLELGAEDQDLAEGMLLNAKLGYDVFHQYDKFKRESSRDSAMAEMATWIVREDGDKMIIWAHNIHVGKQESEMNGYPVGGIGKFILQKYPDNYFVMGMGTAEGTYAATTDRTVTNSNYMGSYMLDPTAEGSYEHLLNKIDVPAFILGKEHLKSLPEKSLHWAVGYPNDSGEKTYVTAKITELYDAFLFIKKTNAASFLN